MAIWLLYIIVVSALVGTAALLMERAAAPGGGRLRWIWVGAFAAALAVAGLPGPTLGADWLSGLTEHWAPTGSGSAVLGTSILAAPETAAAQPGPSTGLLAVWDGMGGLDGLVMALWATMVLLLMGRWTWAALQVSRQLRRWPTLELPEGRVTVSSATGPAVVGIIRNRVVLPRWCLELTESERELIVAHEREHLRARDSLLLGVTTLLTVLMPWNLPFWGYRKRLREAVEMDCDTRVLRRLPRARHAYGSLLLTVAARTAAARPAFLTFSPHSSALGRRIQMLTTDTRGVSGIRTISLLAGGLMLVAVSCLVPGPDRDTESPTAPAEEAALEVPQEEAEVAEEPTFTPFTQAPEITNRTEVARAVQREYPSELREAGIGGTATLHFYIDEEGTVQNVMVSESSGHERLDRAAEAVAREFSFSPAMNQDQVVPVWIQLPVTFQADESGAGEGAAGEERIEVGDAEDPADDGARQADAQAPTFTPFTVAPEVRNRDEVARALEAAYPDELRGAGIGGTALVHLYIDDEGTVQNVIMSESSGHERLDRAAEAVAGEFSFSPALNRDEPVSVWIQLPITFQAR